MGLHSEEFNEPTFELYKMLLENQFDLKVFSFTVEEISKVINAYCSKSYRYLIGLKVDSLYSSLKRKGWSETDAIEFIMDLEINLKEKGITIEWVKNKSPSDYEEAKKRIERVTCG